MKRLKQLRTDKNLTQKDVANYLGVDRTTYVKYETGASEPNFDTLQRLASFFDVTTDYLLGQQPTPPSIDDDTLKAAFYGDYSDKLSPAEVDELWEDAKEYALFKAQQRINKKD